ncbi:cytochrome c oxidase subunit 3 [Pedobacter montanisoli]|uniref:Cytochrome c oxidase subunit 3 n=1 Tax=Pedobacter montanisoli TaxID=2923277 RepID=A0ABS9ZRP8_9SPHI|nr:cytochrome c oxidase subunit 3 [Pedobacter montanisoli]MCJ0741250.1 cytochrome c oxidase subunit 3 [Pedobacter montanisoli]
MVHTMQQNNAPVEFNAKPRKFAMWLFVVSSIIMFGGFTSYYLVFSASKGKGHGLVLPDAFMYSTAVLVLSSVFLFLAARALRNKQLKQQQLYLWITVILGLVFAYLQFRAWSSLYLSGAVLINNNAAISMVYLLSGMHLLHIVAGLALVISALVGSYGKIDHAKLVYRQDIASIFWHFIDILWIYLYVFLLLNS